MRGVTSTGATQWRVAPGGCRSRAIAATAAIAAAGCSFDLPAAGTGEQPPDAAPPDASPSPACLASTIYTEVAGRRYRQLSAGVGYDRAIAQCAADGAHLAVIDSAAENAALSIFTTEEVWIGYDDLTVDGTFAWVTGAPPAFSGFAVGEPNDAGGEDCVHMRNDGTWSDESCADNKRPLCECDPAHRAPPVPMCMTIPGAVERRGRGYFVRAAAKTWADAQADCAAIGAHLPAIADLTENADVDSLITGAQWLGYSDAVQETQFRWVNGSTSRYQQWIGGVPASDEEDCAALQDGGTWDDQACGELHRYACECDPAAP